jgi:HD-GYP domain-containing protein (c-di-GMP phosphodiesterase class II)
MSLDRPSGAPSSGADASRDGGGDEELSGLAGAARVRVRGFALLDALERHVAGAAEHANATGAYAFATAVALGGGREQAELVREAARLHDVGRVYVPAEVLTAAPDALSDEQRAQLGAHHEAGASLARGAGIPEEVCGWILNARERFDGAGPAGLEGEAIPAEARIIRAACACDRLLSWHASGGRGDPATAAAEALRGASGRELDPRVVDALVGVLARAARTGGASPAG